GFLAFRQFETNGQRVFVIAGVQVADILTTQRGINSLHDAGLCHAQHRGTLTVDIDPPFFLVVFDVIIDIDNVRGAFKQRAQWFGGGNLALVIRAIHFRHNGGHHRRAGRDFHHFDVGIHGAANGLQRLAYGKSNVVALALTLGFVHQIHLNIALMGHVAQVILAHQTVEVNGGRSAGVQLDVFDFRYVYQLVGQRFQQRQGLLYRRAFRHIDNDLEFRFVVERQHFQHHQLEHRQGHGQHDQTGDAGEQQHPLFTGLGAFNKWTQQAVKEIVQLALLRVVFTAMIAMFHGVVLAVQQFVRQPGRYHEGDHQRNQHAGGGVDRNRAHIGAHQAGDERHGHQGRNDGEGGQNGWAAHFIDRHRNNFQQFFLTQVHVPVDVFHHHNGVVDQNADGENQREQRYAVEG